MSRASRFVISAIVCLLSAIATANEAGLAALISEKVSFLSAHEAREYTKLYQLEFARCLSVEEKISQEHLKRRICLERAMDKIQEVTEALPHLQQRILNKKIQTLSLNGHISNRIVYPIVNEPTLGIVGDSLAVGSLAAENIDPNVFSLFKDVFFDYLLLGKNAKSETDARQASVLRIFDTPKNKKEKVVRFFENRASNLIDCEECGFGYQMGLAMGIRPANMFVAAQGGASVDEVTDQLHRIAMPLDRLPDHVLISFTGNDICSMSNEFVSPKDKYKEYLKALVGGVTLALQDLKEAKGGTKIYIVAAADVANLIENRNVLSKVVNFYWPAGPQKQTVTCEDVRNQTVGGAEKLANMCDYILGTTTNDRERIERIKQLHQAVVDAQRAAVIELNKLNKKRNIHFYFLDAILETDFKAEDISPDCFHPSLHGHKKMAKEMISELGLKPQEK